MAYGLSDTWTIRSGIGRFLNRPQINTSAAYGFNPPLSEMATVINGNVDAPAGAARRTFPLVMAMFSPDYANASSWAWNVTTDRQMPLQHTVQLSYVGRSASNLERARNINQLQPGTIQANPGVNANALRPYKGFGNITLYETTGKSTLQRDAAAGVAPQPPRGLGYSVAYTWSKTKDDGSTRLEILPNAYDDSGYYGISALDRPHVLITQASYRTPELMSAPGVLKGVFGDWNIGGVFQAQSGVPFDVTTTVDVAGVGPGSGRSTTTSSATRTRGARSSTARAPCGSTRTRSGFPPPGHLRDHVGAQHPAAARLLGSAHVAAQERGAWHASSGTPLGRVQRAEPPDPGIGLHQSDRRGFRDDHVEDREPHDADRAAVCVLRCDARVV